MLPPLAPLSRIARAPGRASACAPVGRGAAAKRPCTLSCSAPRSGVGSEPGGHLKYVGCWPSILFGAGRVLVLQVHARWLRVRGHGGGEQQCGV